MNVSSLQTALCTLGIALSGEICNQMFLRYDVDNSGMISYDEFRAIYEEVNQWVVSRSIESRIMRIVRLQQI